MVKCRAHAGSATCSHRWHPQHAMHRTARERGRGRARADTRKRQTATRAKNDVNRVKAKADAAEKKKEAQEKKCAALGGGRLFPSPPKTGRPTPRPRRRPLRRRRPRRRLPRRSDPARRGESFFWIVAQGSIFTRYPPGALPPGPTRDRSCSWCHAQLFSNVCVRGMAAPSRLVRMPSARESATRQCSRSTPAWVFFSLLLACCAKVQPCIQRAHVATGRHLDASSGPFARLRQRLAFKTHLYTRSHALAHAHRRLRWKHDGQP